MKTLRFSLLISAALMFRVSTHNLSAADMTSQLIVQQGHSKQIRHVVASSEQGLAASSSDDGTIAIWDLSSRMQVRSLVAPDVEAMALCSRHPWLVTARHTQTGGLVPFVELWNLSTGALEKTLMETNFFAHNPMPVGAVRCIALSPDDRLCAIGVASPPSLTEDLVDTAYLFECTTGQRVGSIKCNKTNKSWWGLESMAFSADGKTVYLAAYGTLQIASVGQQKTKVICELDPKFQHADNLTVVSNGDWITMVESESPLETKLFNPTLGIQSIQAVPQRITVRRVRKKEPTFVFSVNAIIFALCFDASGDRLYAATSKGLAAWDLGNGARLPGFKSPNNPMFSLTAANNLLLAAGLSGDLALYAPSTGQKIAAFPRSIEYFNKLLFTDSGRRLLILRGGDLYDLNLSGRESSSVWGGNKSRDWLRLRDAVRDGSTLDVADIEDDKPVLLMEKKDGEGWNATNRVVARHGDNEIALDMRNISPIANISGYLSADGAFAFVCRKNYGTSNIWSTFETSTGKLLGNFILGNLWAEEHSPGKPNTAIGFKEEFMGSTFAEVNAEDGSTLWTIPLRWEYWQPDPHGRFLIFVEETASDIVIVDLQSTNAPHRVNVPEFRGGIPVSLNFEFTYRPDLPILEIEGRGYHLGVNLEKATVFDLPPKGDLKRATLRTASVFTFYGAKSTSPVAGIRAEALSDGSVELVKTTGNERLARLVLGGGYGARADYVVVLTSGYYASSPGAAALACFRSGLSAVSFDQFDLAQNRPDLVLRKLGLADPKDIEFYETLWNRRRLRAGKPEEGSTIDEADRPTIDLRLQNLPLATDALSASIPIEVSARHQKSFSLFIAVNDRWLHPASPGLPLNLTSRGNAETNINVPLSAGNNVIDVWAVGASGAKSLHRRIIITRTSPAAHRALFLITMGISQYKDTNWDLQYAAKDAEDTSAFWAQQDRFSGGIGAASMAKHGAHYGFDELQSVVLTNELVTREALNKVGDFISKAGIDDLVILTFSGHGLRDSNGLYYFATYDIDFSEPEKRGFSERDLKKLLARSGSRENLLILDTCESGEADLNAKEFRVSVGNAVVTARKALDQRYRGLQLRAPSVTAGNVPLEEVFRDLQAGVGASSIAASGPLDFALEDQQWKNGVFTYAMLEGLRSGKADLDKNGRVTFSEICRYIEEEVPRLTKGQQHPTIRNNPLAHDPEILDYPANQFPISTDPDGP